MIIIYNLTKINQIYVTLICVLKLSVQKQLETVLRLFVVS